MKYLLDTHTFLWFAKDDAELPNSIREIIEAPENDISVSIASFWEIGIKNSTGRLPLPTSILGLEMRAESSGIAIVPITIQAVQYVTLMPLHHKDPFDRIIAATAVTMGEVLLSIDTIFDSYSVSRLWK